MPSRRSCDAQPASRRSVVVATRDDGAATAVATVDLAAFGKRLNEWKTVEEVRDGLLAAMPPRSVCLDAGPERWARTRGQGPPRDYLLRFASGGGGTTERLVKLYVYQSRLYMLTIQYDSSKISRDEIEPVVSSFEAFPVSSLRGGLLSSTAAAGLRPPIELPSF